MWTGRGSGQLAQPAMVPIDQLYFPNQGLLSFPVVFLS